jgi:hypothetical protein
VRGFFADEFPPAFKHFIHIKLAAPFGNRAAASTSKGRSVRAKPHVVIRSDQMERAAHEGCFDNSPALDLFGKVFAFGSRAAASTTDVGRRG